ncbi:conserved protein of unknown function (plasmid) [Rhodovastum atsumiense]|uniref:DUF2188 domain-containing protein n=1 Tax=Rhodovastum atsumiense TaxID=504468 RepID=A0A5M6IMT6_9PROT|nr:hypothetical protein [Rhodovastum atsumiense]KAA5609580.1 hypothetical protein F1189_23435 [Rhodovastum atsumiense]CAH2606412.1 conserved protein of unknown function [Rhodovastum atsumiense]
MGNEASQKTWFALFRNGKQVSKAHASRAAALVEAYERGAVIKWGVDLPGDRPGQALDEGYEIRITNGKSNAN